MRCRTSWDSTLTISSHTPKAEAEDALQDANDALDEDDADDGQHC